MEYRWLSVHEIAEYLGIKRDIAYKCIGEKHMPAYKSFASGNSRRKRSTSGAKAAAPGRLLAIEEEKIAR